MSASLVVVRSLTQLSDEINSGAERLSNNVNRALQDAIVIGNALLEAQSQLPRGDFNQWVTDNCVITLSPAYGYMRLATYQHLLPNDITHPTIERNESGRYVGTGTIKKALAYLNAAGSTREGADLRRHDYDEIRHLKQQNRTDDEIAEILGCSTTTVWRALQPEKKRREIRLRESRNQRERARLLRKVRQLEAARAAKGDIDEAYSLLRKCLQHVQAAHDEIAPGTSRRALQGTLTHLHNAEDALGRAAKEITVERAKLA